jgi:hypothetical protein
VDLDVEIEAGAAGDAPCEEAAVSAALLGGLQPMLEVAVLPAKIQVATAGADQGRTQGHALEDPVGVGLEQHPVLERTGLALIGVADHEPLAAVGLATQPPFGPDTKPCPAPPSPTGVLDPRQDDTLALLGPDLETGAVGGTGVEQQVPALDIVFGGEKFSRSVEQWGHPSTSAAM